MTAKPRLGEFGSIRKIYYSYDSLDAKVRRFALYRRVSESQIVREALEQFFEREEQLRVN